MRSREIHGHIPQPLHEAFEDVARYAKEHAPVGDYYGHGKFLNAFEEEIAALLGMDAAVFMPSGTMAQLIALRIWCDRAGVKNIALHATSHLELHEHKAYAALHGLVSHEIGERNRVVGARDFEGFAAPLAAALVELPMREIGGELPSWDELEKIKVTAKSKNIALHMDGARLWEAQAAYDRSFREICAGFNSVYVSFYKGIGALTGAMLLGPKDFIEEAKIWQRRQGGNLFRLAPYVVSARLNFEKRRHRFAGYLNRAREIATFFQSLSCK